MPQYSSRAQEHSSGPEAVPAYGVRIAEAVLCVRFDIIAAAAQQAWREFERRHAATKIPVLLLVPDIMDFFFLNVSDRVTFNEFLSADDETAVRVHQR